MNRSGETPGAFFPRWFLGWIPLGLATAVVFQGAVLPPEKIPAIFLRINDKLIHGTEYFFLFLFAANAFLQARALWLARSPLGFAFIYCLMIGAATEIVQIFIPGRTADLLDWAADGLGAAVALGIVYGLASLLKVSPNRISS